MSTRIKSTKPNNKNDFDTNNEPCGPNLEYDPEYVTLMAKVLPKGDAQYGDFIGVSETPNWGEIEKDCERLLTRTRDINLILLLLRCKIRQHQGLGLLDGLTTLVEVLEKYPNHVHPQPIIEGEHDLTVRCNALATLTDPEGLMDDIRSIVLIKNNASRLQVRDVERAFATPRHTDALSIPSVTQQLEVLRAASNTNLKSIIEANSWVVRLQTWMNAELGDYAPDLTPFMRLIGLFDFTQGPIASKAKTLIPVEKSLLNPIILETTELSPATPSPEAKSTSSNHVLDRHTALQQIITTRKWFEHVEPSSPVSVLLRQAEKLVGKPFSEVIDCIPIELLQRWENS